MPKPRRVPSQTSSKLDFVDYAALSLRQAHTALINASADLGTPEEIEDAKSLARLALGRCNDLLTAHQRGGR